MPALSMVHQLTIQTMELQVPNVIARVVIGRPMIAKQHMIFYKLKLVRQTKYATICVAVIFLFEAVT